MPMDPTILGGGIGTMISISIGLFTTYLAERRSRRSRWQQAKEIIVRDLSTSLAEGNTPDSKAILATMRSVMREYGIGGKAGARLEEIVDDMVRMIVSDPFLDSDRRSQLQSDAMRMAEVGKTREFEIPVVERQGSRMSARSIVVGFASTAAVLVLFAGGGTAIPTLQSLPPEYRTSTVMMGAAVGAALLLLLVVLAFSEGNQGKAPKRR